MTEKLIKLLRDKNFVLPQVLFYKYKELNLTLEELYFIIYLLNINSLVFNPKQFSNDLNMDMASILEMVTTLTSKDILSLEMIKEGNIRNEYLKLDKLYNKLAFILINEEDKEKTTSLFDVFEKEFGRTLSPIEYELINGWLDNEFSEELVILIKYYMNGRKKVLKQLKM